MQSTGHESPRAEGLLVPHPFCGREAPPAARLPVPGLGGDRCPPGGQWLLGAGDGGFTERMQPRGPSYTGMGNPRRGHSAGEDNGVYFWHPRF